MNIAIVTGGSRGLGKNASLHIAKQGIGVILTYQNNRAAAEAVVAQIEKDGGKAGALQLDVGKSATFTDFTAQVKTLLRHKWQSDTFNFLVNNAGTGLHAAFEETTEAQFEEVFNVHLKGPYFLTQKLLPLLADHGRIVNISSGLARFSFPGSSAYAMMKGGVEVMTRYMSKELGARGVAVNTVAPGAIETDFSGGMVRDNPAVNQQIASLTNLGRCGLPEDIGPLIAVLLTDAGRWINAQRIEASGGMLT